MSNLEEQNLEGIAIIGMSGRFPGAANVATFWANLCAGVESITTFTDEMLLREKPHLLVKQPDLLERADYVKVGAILEDIEQFDAHFFGITPREAALTDPQQRLFLECAWSALEDAAYDPQRFDGWVGVFAGVGTNYYALDHVYTNVEAVQALGRLQATLANERDYLTTRISYKLGLTGPSVNVQTACSTSLVATHLACQSLLNYQCDMALAGGVSIRLPQVEGYIWQEGSFNSPDGHCRTFDAKAQGTLFGGGLGIIVLKRLADAVADGDHIYAVIKGSAVNNDGKDKIGFTAPGRAGQTTVIMTALTAADVDPATISYVEAHGTGTYLGDPIEVQALTRAYQASTDKKGYCAIGSVKTNIGHSDTAAGAASLIKTALALKHRLIPPSLNFETPNPQIDFENSPFYVNTRLASWESGPQPRRAAVSSFGIGGTNAHAILEEAPELPPTSDSRPWQLLLLSAKTATALDQLTTNLATYLKQQPDVSLADVAYTLQVGRQVFDYRRAIVCRDHSDAIETLEIGDPKRIRSRTQAPQKRPITFMFSGQGAQYVLMGEELYKTEPVFREQVDKCATLLRPYLGLDLREIFYAGSARLETATQQLTQTAITQPALFVIEYALAQLWLSWGIQPQAMIGHSIGEYVAACLAGVFSLEDALKLVAARGRLMQTVPTGAMMSVSLSEKELQPYLGAEISLAVINGLSRTVVAGPTAAIENLEQRLTQAGILCQRLHTSHAFHSSMMDPILETFTAHVRTVSLNPPQIPFIANVTGTWITAEEATDPSYWAKHLRQTVRFADGLTVLLQDPKRLLLEVGPGRTLATLVRQHPAKAPDHIILSSLRHPHDQESDTAFLLGTLGDLWLSAVDIDWAGYYANEERRRLSLPGYPFERQRYWLERPAEDGTKKSGRSGRQPLADWFYLPSWKRSLPPVANPAAVQDKRWLLFADELGLAQQLATRLQEHGAQPILVQAGQQFGRLDEQTYTLNPQESDHFSQLFDVLNQQDKRPDFILHLWNVTDPERAATDPPSSSFDSLLLLAQALGKQSGTGKIAITLLSNNLYRAISTDLPHSPQRALLLGPCKVIPQEYPHLACHHVDVTLPNQLPLPPAFLDQLLGECATTSPDQVVAYRGRDRLVQTFEPVRLDELLPGQEQRLRQQGVYLITGGLGGIGLVLADYLAQTFQARLVLTSRAGLPPRSTWAEWLSNHEPTDRTSQQIGQVQALEAAGAAVLVLAADVTNRSQMAAAVEQARATFGDLNGVIHAAGLPGAGLIQFKTIEAAQQVLAPKVQGTQILAELLRPFPLDFFCLCSSIIGITGNLGQVDYCAANAFLDVFAETHTSQTGTFTVSINWDGWQEVGMLVNTEHLRGPRLITPAKNGHAPTHNNPLPERIISPTAEKSPAANGSTPIHPFLDQTHVEGEDQVRYLTELRADQQWLLAEHRILGRAAPPGTSYLEMVRAAFTHLTGRQPVELSDVLFLTPILVDPSENRTVHTLLEKVDQGYHFRILTQSSPAEWQEHAQGQVNTFANAGEPMSRDLTAILGRCQVASFTINEPLNQDGSFVYWGPRWQCLRQVHLGQGEAIAHLHLPEAFTHDLADLVLHPALLDVATAVASQFSPSERFLPFGYDRIRIYAPLPSRFYSHLTHRQNHLGGQEFLRADVSLLDEQGQLLVEIEGFTLKRVDSQAAGRLQTTQTNQTRPPSPAGSRAYTGMIRPAEGVEAFRRILSRSTLSQMAVATTDLPGRIEQTIAAHASDLLNQTAAARGQTAVYARPDLNTSYVAPRSQLEKTLAQIWQDLLGIAQVGIHDSFFELGGDSVLGIQVALQAGKLGLDITPAQLFESPTIEQLAQLLPGQTLSDEREENEITAGQFPLTPAPYRFLAKKATNLHEGFLELLVETPPSLDPAILAEAVSQLYLHHDALRLRFVPEEAGWRPFMAEPDQLVPFSIIHLPAASGAKHASFLKMATTKLGESLSLTEGPVIQIAYLDNNLGRPGHLLLVAHQLVMDQPSLEILLDDLSTAYQQLQQGQAVQLPPKTTPYKQWATQLAQESLAQVEQEVDYWHAQPWQQIILLPANQTNDEQEEGIPYSTQLVRFNPAESHFLLQEAAAHYNVEPIDVLLTALAQTMTSWANSPYLFLERPLNGRQLLSKKLDLSHTVGEFTIYAPLLLHLSNPLDIEEALKHVKEQLRHLPPHGLTYAVLCTLDQHEKLPMLPDPQLIFSFEELNKPDRPQSNLFKRTTTLTDSPPDFHTIRPNQLGLFGYIVDNQLEIQWRYQESVYQSTTVAQWAQRFLAAIQAIMTHLQADKKEVLTPSDFPEAGLSQTALDKFLAKFGQS